MLLTVEEFKNELRKYKVRFHPDSAILVASGYQFDPAKGARITIEADRESLFFSGFGRIQFSQLNDITGNDIDRFGYVNSEWWDTLYPAIKSIISRIGSPEPELTEASTEDKIHIILQSHNVEQSDEEAEKTCITEDGFARIYASDLVIVIQPEEELMHISTSTSVRTFTRGFTEWNNVDAQNIPDFWRYVNYVWFNDNLKPALFEIIELLESPDTSSETKLPDEIASIIEADKGIVNCCLKNNVLFLEKNDAGLKGQIYEFALSSEAVNYRIDNGPWKHSSALQYINSHPSEEWSNTVLQLVCELERQSPENEEIIQLRKQVEELQGRLSVYEQPLGRTLVVKQDQLRELEMGIKVHNQRIQELRDRSESMLQKKEIIGKEIELLESKIEFEQSGVTSGS